MSADFKAVGDAIAVRFGPTIVSAPSGETNIKVSTASLPAVIPDEPYVLVFPPTLNFTYGPSLLKTMASYAVRFYIYKSTRDIPYNADLLYKWQTQLYATLVGQTHLGLSAYVATATMTSVIPGPITYNGVEFHGLEWTVNVVMAEGLSAVA